VGQVYQRTTIPSIRADDRTSVRATVAGLRPLGWGPKPQTFWRKGSCDTLSWNSSIRMVPLEDTSIISHPVLTGWIQNAERNAGKPCFPSRKRNLCLRRSRGSYGRIAIPAIHPVGSGWLIRLLPVGHALLMLEFQTLSLPLYWCIFSVDSESPKARTQRVRREATGCQKHVTRQPRHSRNSCRG